MNMRVRPYPDKLGEIEAALLSRLGTKIVRYEPILSEYWPEGQTFPVGFFDVDMQRLKASGVEGVLLLLDDQPPAYMDWTRQLHAYKSMISRILAAGLTVSVNIANELQPADFSDLAGLRRCEWLTMQIAGTYEFKGIPIYGPSFGSWHELGDHDKQLWATDAALRRIRENAEACRLLRRCTRPAVNVYAIGETPGLMAKRFAQLWSVYKVHWMAITRKVPVLTEWGVSPTLCGTKDRTPFIQALRSQIAELRVPEAWFFTSIDDEWGLLDSAGNQLVAL